MSDYCTESDAGSTSLVWLRQPDTLTQVDDIEVNARRIAVLYGRPAADDVRRRFEHVRLVCEQRGWQLQESLTTNASRNIVRAVETPNGPLVAKAPCGGAAREAAALRGWRGLRGAVQAPNWATGDDTVVFVERLPGATMRPTNVLHHREPIEWLLRQLHSRTAPDGVLPLADHVGEVAQWTTSTLADHGVVVDFSWVPALFGHGKDRLLHGDLTCRNLLLHDGSLTAIDPVGVAGDPAWDWAVLAARTAWWFDPELVLERFADGTAGIDPWLLRVAAGFAAAHMAAGELFAGPLHGVDPLVALHRARRLAPAAFVPVQAGPGAAVALRLGRDAVPAWADALVALVDDDAMSLPVHPNTLVVEARDSDDPVAAAAVVRRVRAEFPNPARVAVGCVWGQSRSAAVAAGLLHSWGWSASTAHSWVRSHQPDGRGWWPNLTWCAAFAEAAGDDTIVEVARRARRLVAPSWEPRVEWETALGW